jgi:hypothetical protein
MRDTEKNVEREALPGRTLEKGREKNGVHRKVALILFRNL